MLASKKVGGNNSNNSRLDNLTVKIIDAGEGLENADLDALVTTANIQHKTKYLQALTKTLDNNFKGYFVVAASQDEVVAWTYIFIDSRFAFHGVFSGVMEKLYNIFPVTFSTAFISSPVAEYNIIHVKDSCKIYENSIIDKMMDGLLKFSKGEKVKLIIAKDLINRYTSQYFHENTGRYNG